MTGTQSGERLKIVLLLLLLLALPPLAGAAEMPGAVALLDPAAGRLPQPGEWLEYVIAFPLDPLENGLAPHPVPPAPEKGGTSGASGLSGPVFDPPEAWRALPLRFEVLSLSADSLLVRMSFSGLTRDVAMPLTRESAAPAFSYDDPPPPTERSTHRIDGFAYEVEIVRREAEEYGFARMASPDLPFGLARFATRDIDLILVAMGSGEPPPFPHPAGGTVTPAPGGFYRRR